jgi:hypothetical protein
MNALIKKKPTTEFIVIFVVFLLLWSYLIIRANTVFFIYDEIFTKWNYMVSWNFIPRDGVLDANNHFTNSFLGGLFIRLFGSDNLWVVRLPNLITFPIYFWSIYGLRHFINAKINFYGLLITLASTAFIIEYFALARGYGMSMAFLVMAIQQMLMYFKYDKKKYLIGTLIGWILAIFANLTLLPIALFAIIYLGLFIWKGRSKRLLIVLLIPLVLIAYLVGYSLELNQSGKFYLGDSSSFFETTVHSITYALWKSSNLWIDIILSCTLLFILVSLALFFLRDKTVFKIEHVFAIFLIASILAILIQNSVLGINFPLDRAALYLVVLFFGALFFTLDRWNIKWGAYPLIFLACFFFVKLFSFDSSLLFRYEHFDKKLLTLIPEKTNQLPSTVGSMDIPMARECLRLEKLPFKSLQSASSPADTLLDYIIIKDKMRPDLPKLYHQIYIDKISNIKLYQRNSFLKKKKRDEFSVDFNNNLEYNSVYKGSLRASQYLRCSGSIENLEITDKTKLVFKSSNAENAMDNSSNAITLNEYTILDQNGRITFDFGIVINERPSTGLLTVFVWNKEIKQLKGTVKLELFDFVVK